MAKHILTVAFMGVVALVAQAQQPPGPFPAIAVKPPAENPGRLRDLSKFPPAERALVLSAVRGLDWLQRANQPDGTFVPGFLPALGARTEAGAFLPQVDATAALLRGARLLRDERALALGKQALLRV